MNGELPRRYRDDEPAAYDIERCLNEEEISEEAKNNARPSEL